MTRFVDNVACARGTKSHFLYIIINEINFSLGAKLVNIVNKPNWHVVHP